MNNFRIAAVAAWIAGISPVAHAYLDPGTGAMLLQLLLGGVAGLLVILKLYWHRIKESISRIFPRKLKSKEKRPRSSPSSKDGAVEPRQTD